LIAAQRLAKAGEGNPLNVGQHQASTCQCFADHCIRETTTTASHSCPQILSPKAGHNAGHKACHTAVLGKSSSNAGYTGNSHGARLVCEEPTCQLTEQRHVSPLHSTLYTAVDDEPTPISLMISYSDRLVCEVGGRWKHVRRGGSGRQDQCA
jgi:hypothetical protein